MCAFTLLARRKACCRDSVNSGVAVETKAVFLVWEVDISDIGDGQVCLMKNIHKTALAEVSHEHEEDHQLEESKNRPSFLLLHLSASFCVSLLSLSHVSITLCPNLPTWKTCSQVRDQANQVNPPWTIISCPYPCR